LIRGGSDPPLAAHVAAARLWPDRDGLPRVDEKLRRMLKELVERRGGGRIGDHGRDRGPHVLKPAVRAARRHGKARVPPAEGRVALAHGVRRGPAEPLGQKVDLVALRLGLRNPDKERAQVRVKFFVIILVDTRVEFV
jgi:hypothetical protein